MDFNKTKILGKTGLKVGRLGVAASYGAPAEAFEEDFEKGCNYFYWGSFRKNSMCIVCVRQLKIFSWDNISGYTT